MKKIIFTVAFVVAAMSLSAQGIVFFEGSFADALKSAKEQNKKVFVDFYAVWCGPCKQMAKDAFPNAQVGEYFNSKFVSCKLNGEAPENKDLVAKFEIRAYPTLMILDADGNEINSVEGAMSATQLVKWAKTQLGDVLTYEQMFEKLKTDKTNEEMIRGLLLGAPDFIVTQEGANHERWVLRIERIYSDYRKQKPLAEFMNPSDFGILMQYNTEPVKNDEVMEYLIANYKDVVSKVGAENLDAYIFSFNTLLIQDLAQRGDMDYVKYLNRVNGDMKPSYDAMMQHADMTPYECLKYLNDAIYIIYNRKNVAEYIALTDEYLTKLGSASASGDYSAAIKTLYEALEGKLPAVAATKGIEWVTKALQFDKIDFGERMELLIMNGDCYKMLSDIENAKKCYNQAYVLSLQFNNPGLSAQVQNMMKDL